MKFNFLLTLFFSAINLFESLHAEPVPKSLQKDYASKSYHLSFGKKDGSRIHAEAAIEFRKFVTTSSMISVDFFTARPDDDVGESCEVRIVFGGAVSSKVTAQEFTSASSDRASRKWSTEQNGSLVVTMFLDASSEEECTQAFRDLEPFQPDSKVPAILSLRFALSDEFTDRNILINETDEKDELHIYSSYDDTHPSDRGIFLGEDVPGTLELKEGKVFSFTLNEKSWLKTNTPLNIQKDQTKFFAENSKSKSRQTCFEIK